MIRGADKVPTLTRQVGNLRISVVDREAMITDSKRDLPLRRVGNDDNWDDVQNDVADSAYLQLHALRHKVGTGSTVHVRVTVLEPV